MCRCFGLRRVRKLDVLLSRTGPGLGRHDGGDPWKAGGSVYDLQKILGHSSIKTTEIYLDYLSPEEQLVAKRVGTKTGAEATVVPLAKEV
jgi:integrase